MSERATKGVQLLLGDPKKAIIRLSIPMMIGMLVQTIYNLADAIWVAGLGSEELAAIGLFFPVFIGIISLASGLGIGASSAISRRIGAKDKKGADNVAIHSLLLTLLLGFLITASMLPSIDRIFALMGAKGEVGELAVEYSRVLLAAAIIMVFNNVANGILRGEGDTKRAMYALIAGSGLNIILDPIYIYTFKMGVVGAAWATLTSIVISATLFFYWFFIKKDTYVGISFRDFQPNKKIAKEILKVGIPASAAQLSMSISMIFLNLIVIKAGGTDGIAVFTSGWRIVMLGNIPLLGMAMAVTSVTGAAFGARDKEKLNTAYLYAIKIGILIELGVAIIIALFTSQVAYLFTYSKGAARIVDDLVGFLRWTAFLYPTIPLGMLTSAMFQGVGKGERALMVTLLRTVVLQVPIAYLFGVIIGFGLTGVWLGIITGNAIAVSISFFWGRVTINEMFRDFQRSASL